MSQTSMRPSRDLDASRPPARKRRLSMASQCCAPLSEASSCRCVLRSGPAFKDGRAREPKSARVILLAGRTARRGLTSARLLLG